MRVDADGARIGAFGSGGVVTAHASSLPFELARAVALQADGAIVIARVVAAEITTGIEALNIQDEPATIADGRLVVARFTKDGRLDAAFGTAGFVTGPEWANFDARDVAVSSDGSIYVAGRWLAAARARGGFTVLRFTREGRLDPSFGDKGVFAPFVEPSGARALVIASDDSVFAGGFLTHSPTGRDFAVAKVH